MKDYRNLTASARIRSFSAPIRQGRRWLAAIAILAVVAFAPVALKPGAVHASAASVRPVQATCRIASTLPIIPDIIGPDTYVVQLGARVFQIHFSFPNPAIAGVVYFCSNGAFSNRCGFDKFAFRPGITSANVAEVSAGDECNKTWGVITSDTSQFTMGFRALFEQGATNTNPGTPAGERFQITVNPNSLAPNSPLPLSSGQFQITALPDDGLPD
ncbi:MAG TPA: hypothetical protein VJX67_20375 [Blastocatellia bacterium]|nr:hypothetical protein [Blastocatellia bacterium]